MRICVALWLALAGSSAAVEKGYVDPAVCRGCHQKIYDTYQQTGMARSFDRVREINALDEFRHELSKQQFSVTKRGPTWFLRRASPPLERSIDYKIGSGDHSSTYAHQDERGGLTELPLSWYSEAGGSWFMSPGYDRPDHSGFQRTVSASCLFCHNAYPSAANSGLGRGIDCQRCHGPGEEHVTRGASITNPAKLTSERRFEVCLQCHLESASRTLPESIRRFDRSPFSWRPGELLSDFQLYFEYTKAPTVDRITVNGSAYSLMKSPCFVRSSGKLQCTTCHDPHQPLRSSGADARYTQVCRSCHSSAHQASTTNCAGCHMQKRRTEDAVHVVMTDHRIRRTPRPENQLAMIPERHDHLSGPVRLLYPASLTDTPVNAVYFAVANHDLRSLAEALQRTSLPYAEPWITLGQGMQRAGDLDAARQAFEHAIEVAPNDNRAYVASADILMSRGKADAATEVLGHGLDRIPDDITLLNAAAVAYVRQQDISAAMKLLSRAVSIDANDAMSWLNLAVCLEAQGDRQGAINAYTQSYALDPALTRAKRRLQELTRDTNPKASQH